MESCHPHQERSQEWHVRTTKHRGQTTVVLSDDLDTTVLALLLDSEGSSTFSMIPGITRRSSIPITREN